MNSVKITTQKAKQKQGYVWLRLIGKNIIFCLLIYLIYLSIDFFLSNQDGGIKISLIERTDTSSNITNIVMGGAILLSFLFVYLINRKEKTSILGNRFDIIFYGVFIFIQMMLLMGILGNTRNLLNKINPKLKKVEQAIITRKRIETKHHKGGGRGGAYSHTMYFIHYHTNEGRESHVVYGGSNWEKFNEGDSVELSYYKGMFYDWYDFIKME